MKKITPFLLLALAGPAGAVTIVPENPAVTPVAVLAPAKLYVDVSFVPGQATLDPFVRQELDQMLREATARGNITEVNVIGWADANYAVLNEAAPVAQVELARNRLRIVEDYLLARSSGNAVTIRTHNLAQRPSALSELIGSADAGTKTSLASMGITDGTSTSRASRAVVLVSIRPK